MSGNQFIMTRQAHDREKDSDSYIFIVLTDLSYIK